MLEALGHEVIVANARHVRLVYAGRFKNDRLDAEKLARLARFNARLVRPMRHRGRAVPDRSLLLPPWPKIATDRALTPRQDLYTISVYEILA